MKQSLTSVFNHVRISFPGVAYMFVTATGTMRFTDIFMNLIDTKSNDLDNDLINNAVQHVKMMGKSYVYTGNGNVSPSTNDEVSRCILQAANAEDDSITHMFVVNNTIVFSDDNFNVKHAALALSKLAEFGADVFLKSSYLNEVEWTAKRYITLINSTEDEKARSILHADMHEAFEYELEYPSNSRTHVYKRADDDFVVTSEDGTSVLMTVVLNEFCKFNLNIRANYAHCTGMSSTACANRYNYETTRFDVEKDWTIPMMIDRCYEMAIEVHTKELVMLGFDEDSAAECVRALWRTKI